MSDKKEFTWYQIVGGIGAAIAVTATLTSGFWAAVSDVVLWKFAQDEDLLELDVNEVIDAEQQIKILVNEAKIQRMTDWNIENAAAHRKSLARREEADDALKALKRGELVPAESAED